MQSYCAVPKIVRLNSIRYFIIKIPNKYKLVKSNHGNWNDLRWKSENDVNTEAAKIFALYAKIDKCECQRGEEILPPGQSKIMEIEVEMIEKQGKTSQSFTILE